MLETEKVKIKRGAHKAQATTGPARGMKEVVMEELASGGVHEQLLSSRLQQAATLARDLDGSQLSKSRPAH